MSTPKYFNHMADNLEKTVKDLEQRILVARNNINGLEEDVLFIKDIASEIRNGAKKLEENSMEKTKDQNNQKGT